MFNTPKKINHYYSFPDYPDFKPTLSPLEVLKKGSFGGTYFRSIYSNVTKTEYKNGFESSFPKSILKNYDFSKDILPFNEYNTNHNKYKIKCGQTLEAWEKKNWITKYDPYGWFQWYCRFYYGRRIKDEDRRQINRWKGIASEKGRFRNYLITLIKKKDKKYNDYSVSPKIRQTLLHWGYELTLKDYNNRINMVSS